MLFRLPAEYQPWVAYIFDPLETEPTYWDWAGYERALALPAERTLDNVLRLFQASSETLARYSHKQIDDGFWRIVHFLDEWLDSPDLPVAKRLSVVALVPNVFEETLGEIVCATCYTAYMWWDCLRSVSAWRNNREASEMLPAMRDAMIVMLQSNKPTIVASAIHGLGHLVGDLDDLPARDALLVFRHQTPATVGQVLQQQLEEAIAGRTH